MSGSLIGGTIGGVIGALYGGPQGAQIGFTIGSTAGGMLFPGGKDTEQTGPRLSDLHPQTSTYGTPIPIIYGTFGIAGNVIWAADIIEQQNTTEETAGKGGGPTQKTTTFTYFGDFAILFCEGEVDGISRMWAGPEKRLIYDATLTAPGSTLEGGAVRVYTGDETQLADPLIEQYLGVGNVPGYRGSCYVVFEKFPLANDGNRLPFIVAEIMGKATVAPRNWRLRYTDVSGIWFDVTWASSQRLFVAVGNGYSSPASTIDDNIYAQVATSPDGRNWTTRPIPIKRTENWTAVAAGAGVIVAVGNGNIDALSHPLEDYFVAMRSEDGVTWESSGPAANMFTQYRQFWQDVCYADDLHAFVAVGGQSNSGDPKYNVMVSTDSGGTWALRNAVDAVNGIFLNAVCWSEELHKFVAVGDTVIDHDNVLVSSNGAIWTPATIPSNTVGLWNDVCWSKELSLFVAVGGRFLAGSDQTKRHLITSPDGVVWTSVDLSSLATALFKIDLQTVLWVAEDSCFYAFNVDPGFKAVITSTDGVTWTVQTILGYSDPVIALTVGRDIFGLATNGLGMTVAVEHSQVAGVSSATQALTLSGGSTISSNETTLDEVVTDLSLRAGLDVDQIDVTALDDVVDGYAIARQTSVRGAITPLQQAYYFDAVESQGIGTFVKRGGAVAVTIPDGDLGAYYAGSEPADPLRTVRKMEDELPKIVYTNYLSRATIYEGASKIAQRVIGSSGSETTLDLPLVLSDTKAQEVAEVNLYGAWMQRLSYSTSLSRKYAQIEPTDLVSIGGQTILVAKISDTPMGLRNIEGFRDDPSYYNPVVIVTETEPVEKTVFTLAHTDVVLLDIPILRDVDNEAGFYFAAVGDAPSWHGMQLFKASDGVTFGYVGASSVAAAIGATIDILPDFTGGNVFDPDSTVTVDLEGDATLSSTTQLAVLNGANACALGRQGRWEILQYKNAVHNVDGSWTLSGLLRGRRGTEWAMGLHDAGDTFVALDAASIRRATPSSSEIGLARQYKAVTLGDTMENTGVRTFTNYAEGLECFSPVQLVVERDISDNITLNWVRRTRIGGEWRDGVDVQLGEASEAYEVDIYDTSSPSVILRTITGLTAPTASYSTADQTTDGLTPGDEVTVKVFQMSAVVGRGHDATLTV